MKKYFVALLTCCLCSTTVVADPMDFDADGVSDLTRAVAGSDGTLTWEAKLSSTTSSEQLGQLGKGGDIPILASWSVGAPQIGVVRENKSNKTLQWIIDNNGTTVRRTFGKAGDLVVSGADFNGDGKADGAVVRLVDRKVRWVVAYDLFNSEKETPETTSYTFGEVGDRVFYARPSGGSVDWIGVMRAGRGNKSTARLRNLVTSETLQYNRMPRFASQNDRPRAFPIRQDDGSDLVGFVTAANGKTLIRVFSFDGSAVGSHTFEGTGNQIVGDFDGNGEGYEVWFQGSKESGIFNPKSGDVTATSFGGKGVVDEFVVETVGTTAQPTPTPGPVDDVTASGCTTVAPWPGTHIYKTRGSDHFSDIRRHTIGVILKVGASGPFPQCVVAVDSKGNPIANLGLYQTGFGWAARYYAGWGCGSQTPLGGASVASAALAKTGTSNIYVKFDNVCYGPINASQCVNSISC